MTGGAGYVGGALVERLRKEPELQVRVFDNLLYEDSYLKPVDFVYGDVTNPEILGPHLDWADAVIWLSAIVGDPACALDPSRTMNVNTRSLEFVRDRFAGRFIFPSTCSVYGAAEGLLTEDSPFNPQSIYAESKIKAESIVGQMANSIIFRLGTLFGVSDEHARIRSDLVLNVLTIRATTMGEMNVFGGKQARPLLHVRDAGAAMHEALVGGKTGTYNLHTENVTIMQLAERIKRIIPSSEILESSSQFEDTRNYSVSSQKALQELSFNPQLSIENGIREIADLAESKRVPNFGLARFSNVRALGGGID